MTAVKTIISKGGDIYKETSTGTKSIEFCLRLSLRTEIENFQKTETNKNSQVTGKNITTNVFTKIYL